MVSFRIRRSLRTESRGQRCFRLASTARSFSNGVWIFQNRRVSFSKIADRFTTKTKIPATAGGYTVRSDGRASLGRRGRWKSQTISNSTLENSPFRSTMRELTTKANRDSFSDHARSPTTATKPQAKDLNGTTKHIPVASPTGLWRPASPVDASCPIAIEMV